MERAIAPNRTAATAASKPMAALPSLIRIRSRYTRFVGTMKLILPLVAGLLITMVIAWPQIGEQPATLQLVSAPVQVAGPEGGQKVVNARFTGRDRNDQPYVLTADEARQPNTNSNRVQLKNPKADITLKSGAWVAATAPRGVYSTEDSVLTLDGGISLYRDDGYEIRTRSATIDLGRGTARGANRVVGSGPSGTLAAKGFRILNEGQRLLFTGKSKLVLPNKRTGGKR